MTSEVRSQPIVINAEPEHDGIRVTVLLALIVGLIVGFFVINWLVTLLSGGQVRDFNLVVSCVGAFPFAFLVIFLTELILKRTWPSGITLELQSAPTQMLTLRTDQGNHRPFTLGESYAQLNWFFSLKGYPRGGRERRPSNRWFCMAIEVQQDDEQLSLYAYMPPKRMEALTQEEETAVSFHQIFPPDLYDTSIRARIGQPTRPNIPTDIIRSTSGRYWLAERRRWQDGIELSPDDFETLVQFLASL